MYFVHTKSPTNPSRLFSRNILPFFIILLALSSGIFSIAQGLPLPFQNISVDDGLPQNSITAIIQDNQGFIWIGTQDGLAKYDGYKFDVFRHDKNNPNSLSHNFIWNITKDHEGILWITTLGNGLTRLDPVTGEFSQFLYNEQDGIGLSHWNTFSTLRQDSILYVGTNESLDRINLHSNSTSTYYPGLELGKDSITSLIRAIAPDADSRKIWMSTKLGLTQFDVKLNTFEYFPKSPFGNEISLRNIYTITPQGDSLIICTSTHVLSLNFKETREQVLYDGTSQAPGTVSGLHGFMLGKKESDFIFSRNGVLERNRETGAIIHHAYDTQNQLSIVHDYVISMLQTSDCALWVGTRNGLSTVRVKDAGFLRFGKSKNPKKSLEGKGAKCFVQHDDSLLLTGTSEGIEIINIRSGDIKHIDQLAKEGLRADSRYTLSLIKDNQGILWAGSRGGGLTRIDKDDEGKFEFDYSPLDGASIQYILDDDSLLWLGSSGRGLIKYSKDKGLLRSYPSVGDSLGPSHPYVYCVMRDSKKNFWIGTPTGGINLFDSKKERFVHLNEKSESGLSGYTILCFFQDSQDQVWVGTSSGLSKLIDPLPTNLFDKLENREMHLNFRHFGREAGFPNEVIYGIIEDHNGFLWISTNDGLVKFDPTTETVSNVFNRADGCQNSEYNQNAYITLSDRRLVFGGVNGIQVFHPENLDMLAATPKVVLTKIEVNKQPFIPRNEKSEFIYEQNDISFEFAALSFINTQENKYKYRLKGFDDTWYSRKSNRLVTFTNLDPGQYEFEVMAANCDGVWNPVPNTFSFSIGLPPWLRWYAYLLYALLFVSLVYLILKWRTMQVRKEERRKTDIQKARSEERELFRKRSARDFHDEAGNKITRINLLVELAKTDPDANPKLKDYLNKIAQNTSELSLGMRDFNWALDAEKDSLFDLLERIKIFGESMYEGDQAHFELRGLKEEFNAYKLPMTLRRDLLMIFKEAINNAVKHSESNRSLLSATSNQNGIEIRFCDFGKGISKQDNVQGYGLKNMEERAKKNKINFKHFSHETDGTCISINLPHMRGADTE